MNACRRIHSLRAHRQRNNANTHENWHSTSGFKQQRGDELATVLTLYTVIVMVLLMAIWGAWTRKDSYEGYGNGDAFEKTYMSYPKEHSQSSVQPQAETSVSCKQASVESVLLQPSDSSIIISQTSSLSFMEKYSQLYRGL